MSFGSPKKIKSAVSKALKHYYPRKASRRTRFDELKKYLKVYDLHQEGLKLKDIIEKIQDKADKEKSEDPDVQRKYRRYIKKAKIIISNTEMGQFPMPWLQL